MISKGIYIICFKIAIKVHAYQACDIRNKKQKQESSKKIQGFLIKYKEKIREAGFPGKWQELEINSVPATIPCNNHN